MKRAALGLGLTLLAALAIGLGLFYARPELYAGGSAGAGAAADYGLFCKEHGVPEKFCTLCHEELKKSLLRCPEHGDIPEAICTKCHPEVERKNDIRMCPKGHGLPEHFCVECGKATTASAAPPDDGWCATHHKPETLCAECIADPGSHDDATTGKVCRQPLPLVRLASAKLGREIGLETAEAVLETHAHVFEANAETAFDANRYADVSPRVAGFLSQVRADLGDVVAAGEVVAVVDSPAVSTAKSHYVSASETVTLNRVSNDRVQVLIQKNAIPAMQELESRTALSHAELAAMDAGQTLRNLGFDEAAMQEIVRTKDTSSLLPIVAPIGGTIVRRHAVLGEAVEAMSQLFSVVDTRTMWLWIDVYEADIDGVAVGQGVTFTTGGSTVEGKVTWVGAEVDETTRTTKVRAEVANVDGRIRANQFGLAAVRVGEAHEVVVVPAAAVQKKDQEEVVFVPQAGGVYRPQRIVAGASNRAGVVEVSWGLKPGQRVVTKGSFWLKTEIMKGAIGAGCCE